MLGVITPQLFYGLVFLISGTGKLPGQAEFADILLQSFWNPLMAFLIAHLLPWTGLFLGIALLLNLFPRLASLPGIGDRPYFTLTAYSASGSGCFGERGE
ncbi:MAG: DoxX family membrane protein [Syntrophaceae bacterium]|nr:DoxX family membrane protein [Syntrophaceae bacterium]